MNERFTDNTKHTKYMLAICILLMALFVVGCGSKTPEEMYQKAEELMQKGDTVGMMVQAEKIVKQAPDSMAAQKARMLLAQSSAQSGGFEKAREYWQDIVDNVGLDEQIGQMAYSFYMRSYAEEQNFDGALQAIEETSPTLKGHPQLQQTVTRYMAQIYHEQGKKEEAYQIMKDLRSDAEEPQMYWFFTRDLVDMYVRDEDFTTAAEELKASITESMATSPTLKQVNPQQYAAAQLELAGLYSAAEDNDAAMNVLEEMRTQAASPQEYIRYTEEMVKIHRLNNDYMKAIQAYRDFLEKYPESELVAETNFGIAFFYHRAAQENENEAQAKEMEAQAEAAFDKAIDIFNERLEQAISSEEIARAAMSIGQAYAAMDKTEKAVESYEYILENTTKSQAWLTALEQIAMLYMANVEYDKAISTFRTMQNKFPESQDIINSAEQAITSLKERAAEAEKMNLSTETLQQALPKLPDVEGLEAE